MGAPFNHDVVTMSAAQLATEREVLGGLAQSVRDLAEASMLTTVDDDEATEIRRRIDELVVRLRASRIAGPLGVTVTTSGRVRGHGNAVVGMRNPIAVPLDIQRSGDGRAWADFELNALYEGPPTMVHGGVLALVLDQVFGEAAADSGTPGMTGTLTLRYLQPTPLGRCSAEAWLDHREGVKTIVRGVFRNAAGEVTVEAEGIFILPRWAREGLGGPGGETGDAPPRMD